MSSVDQKLGIIILNYNGLADTIALVDSIREKVNSVSYEVIVVDNASTLGDAEELERLYGQKITLIKSQRNVGYAAGNNIGIAYAAKKGIEYICILNNDTLVTEDFFLSCLQYLQTHTDVAFVGPALVDQNMIIQCTGSRIKLLKAMSYNINKGCHYDELTGKEIYCDMLVGACIMFSTEILLEIGYCPEVYFLFFEETEWCIKARKLGKKIVCLSSHYLIHKGSVSVSKLGGLQEYMMVRNRIVFAKRNLTRLQFVAFMFYNFIRTIYQCYKDGIPVSRYIHYQIDGLTGRIDERYAYIYVRE